MSVILLNWNGERHAALWDSVLQDDYEPTEVLFFDNASTDHSVEAFEALMRLHPAKEAHVVRATHNGGYSEGNNDAFARSTGEIVCFLNNDVRVERGWVGAAVDLFARDPLVGLVQSLAMDLRSPGAVLPSWNLLDPFGYAHPMSLPIDRPTDVFYAGGFALFARRAALRELPFVFPPEFFFLFEDVDLSWRLRLLGWRAVVEPASRVQTLHGGSDPGVYMKRSPMAVTSGTSNRLSVLFTNLGRRALLVFLPLSVVLAIVRFLHALLTGRTAYARAVGAGVVRFARRVPMLFERRRRVQSTRRSTEREVLRGMMAPLPALRELPRLLAMGWEEASISPSRGSSSSPRQDQR